MQALKHLVTGGKSTVPTAPVDSDGHHETDLTVAEGSVAVGLPEAAQGVGVATYKGATISEHAKTVDVTHIHESTVAGQDIGMTTREVQMPVTKMVKETIQVPGTHMETQTVEKEVTVIEQVPHTQKETIMRDELVTREEIVLDHKVVDKPVTVMKPVHTDNPVVVPRAVMLARPNEVMKSIKVIRPENKNEKVVMQRAVEVKRKVKVMRPVVTKKTITIDKPVPTAAKVNITVPEIRDSSMNIQVPHEEQKSVNVQVPVTVIRSAEEEVIQPVKAQLVDNIKPEDIVAVQPVDWTKIPVGLPFTELVTRAKNLTVTSLHTESVHTRQTWMQPKQYQQMGYKMVPTKVTVTETEMKEFEEEITEIILEPFTLDVMVSHMNEVEESWPVAQEREEEVIVSEVTLEPVMTMVPEIGMEAVDIDVPRTVTHTETIQHPHTVEKVVMVDQAKTVMQKVDVQVPVEHMDTVEIEKPVTTYETRTVDVPVSVDKDVVVQTMTERQEVVMDQSAKASTGQVAYRTAKTVMQPTAVHGHVVVEENVGIAKVGAAGLTERAELQAHNLIQQDGVYVANPQTAPGGEGLLVGVKPANVVAPDAVLHNVEQVPARVGVDGELVGEKYVDGMRTLIDEKTVAGGVVVSNTDYGIQGDSKFGAVGDSAVAGKYVVRDTVYEVEETRQKALFLESLSEEERAALILREALDIEEEKQRLLLVRKDSSDDEKHRVVLVEPIIDTEEETKKGLLGRMKAKMQHK